MALSILIENHREMDARTARHARTTNTPKIVDPQINAGYLSCFKTEPPPSKPDEVSLAIKPLNSYAVLGDSLLTVSSVKGLVYTEVDVNFRQICRW